MGKENWSMHFYTQTVHQVEASELEFAIQELVDSDYVLPEPSAPRIRADDIVEIDTLGAESRPDWQPTHRALCGLASDHGYAWGLWQIKF